MASEILTYACLCLMYEKLMTKKAYYNSGGMCDGLRKQNRWSELWKHFESEENLMVIGAKKGNS